MMVGSLARPQSTIRNAFALRDPRFYLPTTDHRPPITVTLSSLNCGRQDIVFMSDEVTVMKRMLLFAVLVMVAGVAVAQNTQRPPSPYVPFMGDWILPAAV